MRVSYRDEYVAPLPEGHIFPMKKFSILKEYLLRTGLIKPNEIIKPSLCDLSTLYLFHDVDYVNKIENGDLTYKEERRLGLTWSNALAQRSRYAVQGTINAAIMALEDGIAANLAGGTHHAMPDYGEGFCVYNDVACAILYLKHSMWVKNVIVIDLDVHQGNGTSFAFQNDQTVVTISIHGHKNYPFIKPKSTIDIGLADNTDDTEYLTVLSDMLEYTSDKFNPDLVFYLGGIDVLDKDHYGRISLTHKGLYERDKMIIDHFGKKGIPITLLLSGGYAPSFEQTAFAHSLMFRAAKESF